jgi:hypothetical protein
MAAAVGLSPASIQRIWKAHGLKPHRVRTFKLSRDPLFVEKLQDVVGLYLNPPEHALVLSVDEKSQIQALDRTQPGLPMKSGRAGTMTHDYKRNGTTTLFAALNTLDGSVIGQCLPRHHHQEFLKFLRTINHEIGKDVTTGIKIPKNTGIKIPTSRNNKMSCVTSNSTGGLKEDDYIGRVSGGSGVVQKGYIAERNWQTNGIGS